MTDSNGDRRLDDLAEVLQNHFGINSPEVARGQANDLLRGMSIAGAIQSLDADNVAPDKDQEHIRKAAKSVASAYNHLLQVGWHGQKTFAAVLEPFLDESDYSFLVNSGARHLAKRALLERVKNLSEALESAIDEVNLEGAPVTTAFGEGPEYEKFRTTKTKKSKAKFFADECAELFYDKTSELPKVRTDAYSEKSSAYGPFLDFVADAFGAAGINASAEKWARKAAKDFSQKKL